MGMVNGPSPRPSPRAAGRGRLRVTAPIDGCRSTRCPAGTLLGHSQAGRGEGVGLVEGFRYR
jgi:hypothetical protein